MDEDEFANEKHVPIHSNNPPLSRVNTLGSGEERLSLKELMDLCTKLSDRVLDLETTKTAQAKEIDSLKKRVKKLERKRKSKPLGMKRLFKIGRSGRYGDNLMFDTGILDNEQDMTEKEVDMAEKDVSTANPVTTTTTVDELTLAQTLIEIKVVKPKAITTAATTTTIVVSIPKAIGVVVQEPIEFTTTTSPSQPSQLPQTKDKGKAKMVEPKNPLKKKDQIIRKKLAYTKEEDANIAEWDGVQAMMNEDYGLTTKLQAEEQGELTIEEKSRLFMDLINKRKKHFARLRGEEQRRKPPTKAEKRNTMTTYLKTWVNIFVDMDTELVKDSKTRTKESSKRAGEELESENLKKQKFQNLHIFMLVEKKYPLTPATITEMLNKKLQADHWNEMCYQLLKLNDKTTQESGSVDWHPS
ncbi:hypothetical protein Tco_0044258 [Tanacetum coccineum]